MTDAQPPRRTTPTTSSPRGDREIPNAPEDIAHREDAEAVKAELAAVGVYPMKPGVYPTVDRKGFVRLTFEEVRRLIALGQD